MSAALTPGPVIRSSLEVCVRSPGVSQAPLRIAGWVCGSAAPPSAVFFCLPGGMLRSAAYFDLLVPDQPDYSMAEWMVQRGALVLGMDHPGTGDSARVADPFALTADVCADIAHEVLAVWRAQLASGELDDRLPPTGPAPVIGVGHSMGGLIAIVAQARHRSFSGLVNLGHAGDDWASWTMSEQEKAMPAPQRRANVQALARVRQESPAPAGRSGPEQPVVFNAADVPASVQQAVRDLKTDLLPSAGLTSMLPDAAAEEKRSITTPLFLAFGEFDNSRQPHRIVSQYPNCPSVHLEVVPGSGHNHNQSARRRELWDAILAWTGSLPG
jgi:pimeloyl-ACP methyl ester carboxylesterase